MNEDEKVVTRVHVEVRTKLFVPIGANSPVRIKDLGRRRSTVITTLMDQQNSSLTRTGSRLSMSAGAIMNGLERPTSTVISIRSMRMRPRFTSVRSTSPRVVTSLTLFLQMR